MTKSIFKKMMKFIKAGKFSFNFVALVFRVKIWLLFRYARDETQVITDTSDLLETLMASICETQKGRRSWVILRSKDRRPPKKRIGSFLGLLGLLRKPVKPRDRKDRTET